MLQPATLLTDTETKYLAFFLKEKENLHSIPEPHKSELLFSDKLRRKAKTNLGIKTSQANVLFSSIKKKGLIKVSENGGYSLVKLLDSIDFDTQQIIFKFEQL